MSDERSVVAVSSSTSRLVIHVAQVLCLAVFGLRQCG